MVKELGSGIQKRQEELETNSKANQKLFYKILKTLTQEKQTINYIKNKNRTIMEDKNEIINI